MSILLKVYTLLLAGAYKLVHERSEVYSSYVCTSMQYKYTFIVKCAIWPVMNNVSRCRRNWQAACTIMRSKRGQFKGSDVITWNMYSARFSFQSPSPSFIYDCISLVPRPLRLSIVYTSYTLRIQLRPSKASTNPRVIATQFCCVMSTPTKYIRMC